MSTTRHLRLLATLLLAFVWIPALAWNTGGHRVAARIAWQSLQPAQQATLWEILQAHPDFPHWHSRHRHALERVQSAPDRSAVFAEAACWADAIRDAADYSDGDPSASVSGSKLPDRLRHRDWHFVNQPLGEPGRTILGGQLHNAIPRLVLMLAGPDREQQAFALVWLLHLVADLHQPLHVATRRLGRNRHDSGGNLVAVRVDPTLIGADQRGRRMSLHAYWDDLVAPPWLRGARLDRLAGRLMAEYAPPVEAGQAADWQLESYRLAEVAYRALHQGGRVAMIDIADHQRNRRIAERQIALAGYRLADLLRRLLKQAARSAEHHSGLQRGSGKELSARHSAPARPLQ